MEGMTFCHEMQEVKSLLRQIIKSDKSGEDQLQIFPASIKDLTLSANTGYMVDKTINRRLKFISVDVPDGITVYVYRDKVLWCYFTHESGSMDFENGVFFGEIKLEAVNTTAYPLRWSVKMVWSA